MNVKPRYINKQQHSSSCGPVAILNARKWLGLKHTSYRENLRYFKKFGYDSNEGISAKDLSKTLNKMNIRYKRKSYAVVTDIEDILSRGNAVIVCYAWHCKSLNEDGSHFIFIERDTGKCFRAWNWSLNWKKPYLHKKILRKWFRYSKESFGPRYDVVRPVVWEIFRD